MNISTLLTDYLADSSAEGRKKLSQLRTAITEALNDEQDYAPDDNPEWGPVRLIMRDDTVGGGLHGNLNKPVIDLTKRMAYIKKQNEDISEQVNAGFILVSSFEEGATLTLSNEVLLFEQDGQYYRWTGDLPKVVDVNSTPENSGGIGGGKWVLVGDSALRYQLKKDDGFKNIGSFSDIEKLRKTAPESNGDRVWLNSYYEGENVGGGIFVGSLTHADDDEGMIIGKDNYHWCRLAADVKLSYYGIKRSDVQSEKKIDCTKKLQNAINFAVNNNLPLISDFVSKNRDSDQNYEDRFGVFVRKTIDLTNIRIMRGQFKILIDSRPAGKSLDFFDEPENSYAVILKNGRFDDNDNFYYGTAGGYGIIEYLEVFDVGIRNRNFNGMFITCAMTDIGFLGAYFFNGHGIRTAPMYNGTINSIRTTHCGNSLQYALFLSLSDAANKTDETNSLAINGLVIHDSHDKAFYISGSKIFISKIHEEGTLVTTNAPPVLNHIEERAGTGYLNSYFSSYGGNFGTLSIDSSPRNNYNHIFAFGSSATSGGTIFSKGDVIVIPGDPAIDGGAINYIRCDTLTVKANAKTNFSRVQVKNYNCTDGDNNTTISSGNIYNVLFNIGNIENTRIMNDVEYNAWSPQGKYTNCRFEKNVRVFGSDTHFYNCMFYGNINITDTCSMIIVNGWLTKNIVIDSSNVFFILHNSRIVGDFSISDITDGVIITDNVIVQGTMTGWKLPTKPYRKNGRTSRVNANPGEGVDYIYSNGWKQLTKIP